MSTRFPTLNVKQLIKVVEQKDFFFSRQTGSHAIYINSDGVRFTIPIHAKRFRERLIETNTC